MVPRARVAVWPTKPSARASSGSFTRTSGSCSTMRWVVAAPIAIASASSRT